MKSKFLLFCILMSLSGCWSTYSLITDLKADQPPAIYGGIRSWYACITHYDISAIWGIYTLLDVPLSFALDTLLLPLTFLLNVFM